MPNIKSAKKRVKTSAKRQEINTLVSSRMKTAIKKVEKEVKTGNKEAVDAKLKDAVKNVDKAVSSGLIHKNKAARVKSRLTKMKNNME